MRDFEKELSELDFSRFSKVKDSLHLRLKLERKQAKALSFDDLQLVTAAGTPGAAAPTGQNLSDQTGIGNGPKNFVHN